jgi:SAM-dependent methyltransferase
MKTYKDSGWKDASAAAFKQQYLLNLRELNDPPNHWKFFLEELNRLSEEETRVIDIGCGVGSLSKFIRMWHGNIPYIGYDYSKSAIETAKQMWGEYGEFYEKDYKDIGQEIKPNDLIVANALCDVLPEGHDCMKHLLSLGAKHIIFLRVRLTRRESYFEEYEAYGEINTYAFYHNKADVNNDIYRFGYGDMRYAVYSDNIVNISAEKGGNNVYLS